MIRSNRSVEWDAMKRRSGVVYMDVTNRIEPSGLNRDRVTFEITLYILDSITERVTVDENGVLVFKDKTQPILKPIRKEYPDYKSETFYGLFPALLPENYDDSTIAQIDYNNALPDNNNNYYWDLTGNDMEVVTQAQLTALLTPTFTDI